MEELLATQGLDAMPELIRTIVNAAMQAEREQHLRAASDQLTLTRPGF